MAETVFSAELKDMSGDEMIPAFLVSGAAVTSITVKNHEEKLIITCTTP